jgi:hypothetical protein
MTIFARQLAKLIGVAERSIHRAEQTGNLGVKDFPGNGVVVDPLFFGCAI